MLLKDLKQSINESADIWPGTPVVIVRPDTHESFPVDSIAFQDGAMEIVPSEVGTKRRKTAKQWVSGISAALIVSLMVAGLVFGAGAFCLAMMRLAVRMWP